MTELLENIQANGELQNYWQAVEKQNDDARKAARKVEKERKRLELGSDYQSSSEEETDHFGNKKPVVDDYDSWNTDSVQEDDDEGIVLQNLD